MLSTFNPTADSYLASATGTTNYGTAFTMLSSYSSGAGGTKHSIMKFDLSAIPSPAIVSAASLVLQVSAYSGVGPFEIARVTQSLWVETQCTWNIYATGSNWGTPGGDIDGVLGRPSAAIPTKTGGWTWATSANWITLVNDARQNRGNILHLLVKRTTESGSDGSVTFSSREGAGSPVLSITWELPSALLLARRRH